jgi:hypothetical protein
MTNISYKMSYNTDLSEYQVTKTENEVTELVYSSSWFTSADSYILNTIMVAVKKVLTEVDKESSAVTFTISAI